MKKQLGAKYQLGSDETQTHLLSVLLVVGCVQIAELVLLQVKYDLFTGGFLQPHSYLTWVDRLQFLGLSVWMDLTLFGTIGAGWYWIARNRNKNCLLAAYNFIFLSLSVMGIWLAVKFKLLSYFNDTLNFLIIKNLGGGSLLEAFSYVANEATIFGVGILMLITTYWLGRPWLRQHAEAFAHDLKPAERPPAGWTLFIVVCLLTIGLVALVNSDSDLRYGLQKKTSYVLIREALDQLTDLDRDGFGLFAFPTDPDSLDSEIYPGALDFPDNGIDEDGYAGDFQWQPPAPDPLTSLAPTPGKHIVLIVLESARSDLLGKTWNGSLVAPNITAMAESGTNAEYAYSHTGYTVFSLKAVFNRTLSSNPDRVSLTDYLSRSGYNLSFISGQDESFGGIASSTGMIAPGHFFFDARSALDDRVYLSTDPGSLRLSEARVVQEFNSRAAEIDWSRPQFFYINLQAAHFPYSHPGMPTPINKKPIPRSEISQNNRTRLEATYWNAIAVADKAIGAMLERLKALGVYEKTVVMILGDHGESLFDDNFLGHGHALNTTQTQIPLVINQPKLSLNSAIGQIDMAELLIQITSDRFNEQEWENPERTQLQFVGPMDNPQLVGIVAYGDVRTILDTRNRKVYFNDFKRWENFDSALGDPVLGPRTRNLIEMWENARWRNQLSKNIEARRLGR